MKDKSKSSSIAVLIPIYQAELTLEEKASLKQCVAVLNKYPAILVKPEKLDVTFIQKEYPDLQAVSFSDDYFTGTDAYNRLLVSIDFYKTFQTYEYVLIYQLDAFVFKDELEQWCQKGYDYIGAPSFHWSELDALPASEKDKFSNALSSRRLVLNGGLSLRKISSFIRYLNIYNRFYKPWKGNEDMLFSQDATRLIPMKLFLKLPSWQEALLFAFEKSPEASYELTGHKLPFGCHAWQRYDPQFWSKFIDIRV